MTGTTVGNYRVVSHLGTLFRATVTYELAGDRTNALAMLERALASGYAVNEVRMDPELASLRKDVRYHRPIGRFEAKRLANP